MQRKLFLTALLLAVSLAGPGGAVAQQSKPNVIFILVDNTGWGDLSVYGGTVPTPRIDSIAQEGLRLNNYTVEQNCTPSRAAILSGRLPLRSGTTRFPLPGEGGGSNGPWRGDFFNPPYEGSYRVPAMVRWPGHIAAGKVSDEMVSAVDWLPTLVGLSGESPRVPTDRPIDGINVAEHLLGKSEKSGRDAVLYFGPDGQAMSVKWKNYKVIFRKADGINAPFTDLQVPAVYDLLNDPGERWNLWETTMDMGWVFRPVTEQIAKFEQSVGSTPTSRRARNSRAIRKTIDIAMTGPHRPRRVAQEGAAHVSGDSGPLRSDTMGARAS